jgi:hypothetical protein
MVLFLLLVALVDGLRLALLVATDHGQTAARSQSPPRGR